MRLDKYLCECGCGTRSEVKKIIKAGMVRIDGYVAKKPEIKVDESADEVSVNGNPVRYTKFVYYMLNKPAGYVSATRDNKDRTVMELLDKKDLREDMFPVGRLDKDTEHVDKTYYVKVKGKVKEEHVEMFREGVDIGEKSLTLPAKLNIIKSLDVSEVYLTISEGKFHQVKRMFKAAGMEVIYLKRIKMGNLELDDTLIPGGYRPLTDSELKMLCERG